MQKKEIIITSLFTPIKMIQSSNLVESPANPDTHIDYSIRNTCKYNKVLLKKHDFVTFLYIINTKKIPLLKIFLQEKD